MASFAFRAGTMLTQRCADTAARVATPLAAVLQQRSISRSVVARVSPKEAAEKLQKEFGDAELVFNPEKEGKAEVERVNQGKLNSPLDEESFARVNYAQETEAAINQQINHEQTFSQTYHQMSSYFNRDNVALPGFAAFFRASSLEERTHAQQLMDFQATRGGRVRFAAIMAPETDYSNEEKGDALHVMQLALALERLNFQMLMDLHEVCERQGDAQACDFTETMLEEQAEGVKVIANYVAQLQRIGKGLPVYEFDRTTMAAAAAAMREEVLPLL